jgi:FkbM family methyltransferase
LWSLEKVDMMKKLIYKIKWLFRFVLKKKKNSNLAVLSEYGKSKFRITSNVEKFRVRQYGGEKEALDYFINLCKASKIIYDIGSSVGLFTITAAKLTKSNSIYAFEPDPETFVRLNENVAINKLKNVRTLQLACSNEVGTIELFTNGVNGFAPSLVEQKDREGAPKASVKIPSNTLDNLIAENKLPVPDLIKIDIEGAEIFCLKGALKLLNGDFGEKPSNIFIEVHPVFLPQFQSSSEEVIELISTYGYKEIWKSDRDDQIHYHFQFVK